MNKKNTNIIISQRASTKATSNFTNKKPIQNHNKNEEGRRSNETNKKVVNIILPQSECNFPPTEANKGPVGRGVGQQSGGKNPIQIPKPRSRSSHTLKNPCTDFILPLPKSCAARAPAVRGQGDKERERGGNDERTKGGEWLDCLSASEIDEILGRYSEATVSAFHFYNFRRGKLGEEEFVKILEEGVESHGRLYVPLHIRYHWILLVVSGKKAGLRGVVWDSAPSVVVKRDVTKYLKTAIQQITFERGMKQLRASNECGLFVIMNAIRLSQGLEVRVPPMPTVAKLAALRPLLAKGEFDRAVDLITGGEILLITGGDWGGELSNKDIDRTFRSLGIQAMAASIAVEVDNARHLREAVAREEGTIIPVWTASHWIAGKAEKGDLLFMDSAPQFSHKWKLAEVATAARAKAWLVDCPHQPSMSNQCGIHLLVNSVLARMDIYLSAQQFPVMDYDVFRRQGITSLVAVLEKVFAARKRALSSVMVGERVVATKGDTWVTGTIKSRRRGMVTVEGWV